MTACAPAACRPTPPARTRCTQVLAATQAFSELLVGEEVSHLPAGVTAALKRALDEKKGHHGPRHYANIPHGERARECDLHDLRGAHLRRSARPAGIFSSNVAIAYEGLLMHEDTKEAQQSTISVLGGAIERRGNGASPHLRRMGDVSALMAAELGLGDQEVELLRVAATLHDIGKTCIPDDILTKGAALTPEEWEIMQSHAYKGYELLVDSTSQTHRLGAVIAHEHHEHWDGSGYPRGLKGEAISLYGASRPWPACWTRWSVKALTKKPGH